MATLVGQTVSHYKILGHLGGGGMGVVYKAQDLKLDRPVALKFLPPELTRDPEAKQRFVHEARAASALDHQNICVVHDIGETEEGQIFIVMAYYEGETLKKKIERRPVSIEEAIDIATQVAQGLAKAHEHGIVHRDIKPANIMLTADGLAKIVDFGLAKLSGGTMLTKTGSTLGTAAYMSPEQGRGDEVDYRADIWALGVVLYELCTGHLPFKAEFQTALVYSILNEDPKPPKDLRSDIPEELERIILKTLQKDPQKRHASSAEIVSELRALQRPRSMAVLPDDLRQILPRIRRSPSTLAALALIVLVVAAAIVWLIDRSASISRAKEELLPQVRKALRADPYNIPLSAFALAQEARHYIGDDPEFQEVWRELPSSMSIVTMPAGAEVSIRHVGTPNAPWISIGTTPLKDLEMPRSYLQMKIDKQGYVPWADIVATFSLDSAKHWVPATYEITLDSAGSTPGGMVRIRGADSLGTFLMDRCEVTNQQYREFVRAGGYANPAYWKVPFTENDSRIQWNEAMKRLVDATGRPGPATWRAGTYPEGEDSHPVAGVSWYEAAAYAEYRGWKLPGIDHWGAARRWCWWDTDLIDKYIIPAGNFSEKGVRAVGVGELFGPYGLRDMAGNVREWCWNENTQGRCIRGGAWDDATYMYTEITQAPPFDRSPKNGFRCIAIVGSIPHSSRAFDPVRPYRTYDLRAVKQVSDEVFRIYRGQYDYDKLPLHPTTELRDQNPGDWVKEKVSFENLNTGERMSAYLYLPTNAVPPFQAVVYFPGSWAHELPSSDSLETIPSFVRSVRYLIKNGRAVVHPITFGMYERRTQEFSGSVMASRWYLEARIRIVKEYRRIIDYLEERPDIATEKIAYYGMSWGAAWANLILAVEERYKAAVLEVGGLRLEPDVRPEVRMLYYTPRISTPVLMLNGEYDLTFPLDINVKPMFDMIATPAAHKRLKVYPTDHFIPPDEFLKESLAWLDTYLGPVTYK